MRHDPAAGRLSTWALALLVGLLTASSALAAPALNATSDKPGLPATPT